MTLKGLKGVRLGESIKRVMMDSSCYYGDAAAGATLLHGLRPTDLEKGLKNPSEVVARSCSSC